MLGGKDIFCEEFVVAEKLKITRKGNKLRDMWTIKWMEYYWNNQSRMNYWMSYLIRKYKERIVNKIWRAEIGRRGIQALQYVKSLMENTYRNFNASQTTS